MSIHDAHRYKELHLGQLRAFCECIRQKSFTAAARALKMSQPAVWQQVRALERHFGVSLLRQSGREWGPTEDGRILLDLAGSLLGSIDSLKETFEQRRRELPRTLFLIGHLGVLVEELARPVVDFCRQYPQIQVAVSPSYSGLGRWLELLLIGDADLAFLPLNVVAAAHRRLVEWEPLCVRPASLVLPTSHPLAGKRRITLTDLVRHPLMLPRTEMPWRKQFDDVLERAGLLSQLQILVEVDITQAACHYASMGLGAALLPFSGEGLEYPRIRVRPVGDLLPGEEIVMAWRRGCTPRSQAQLFADFVRQRLASAKPT
ncbi:MAG TPA: LysR family transcriptional regulator [Gemmataceae bacterium]|jgi:DNA-binding transcriptional LysR family regulator